MNGQQFRKVCQNLSVGKDNPEVIWIKQLRRILDTDIHEKELGCKCTTHIKIGTVHLQDFYETRILFSHSVWVDRFSGWLVEEIRKLKKKQIFLIGYETDIETILFSVQQKFNVNKNFYLQYGVFEEKKYTQNNGYSQTRVNIRYLQGIIEEIQEINELEKYNLVFLCGTSSTLSTFKKMVDQFEVDCRDVINSITDLEKKKNAINKLDYLLDTACYYSLVQVLPLNIQMQSVFSDDCNDRESKIVKRYFINEENGICEKKIFQSKYLVDVYCEWYDADRCRLCFPGKGNEVSESPIIATSETSLVPFQMIEPKYRKNEVCKKKNDTKKTNSLLWGEDGYKYLYYKHIDRMDHHFKYYIRTAHLIKDVLDNKDEKKRKLFIDECDRLNKIYSTGREILNVIVFPSNYGDEVFPLAINQYVFDGNAYLLAINPNKEFRSNFETKYSNLAYLLEQMEWSNVKIRFHYASKQLISLESFSRIKSLIRSLIKKNAERMGIGSDPIEEGKVTLFYSVFVLVSRLSQSSLYDYISDVDKFHEFIKVNIPSLRNNGDSCPICKLRQEAADYSKASITSACSFHWAYKYKYFQPVSIEKAVDIVDAYDIKRRKRHFLRFECENKIWGAIRLCNSEEEYEETLYNSITSGKNAVDAETLISCIKAISTPFLYYKEYEKKVAMRFLLGVLDALSNMDAYDADHEALFLYILGNEMTITFRSIYEQYSTLLVLINCIAGVDSGYCVNPTSIIKIVKFAARLSNEAYVEETLTKSRSTLLSFGNKGDLKICEYRDGKIEHKTDPLFSCIINAFKRVVCGISGDAKIELFDSSMHGNDNGFFASIPQLIFSEEDKYIQEKLLELFYVLYLENSNQVIDIDLNDDKLAVADRYRNTALKKILDFIPKEYSFDASEMKLFFVYKDMHFKNMYYPLIRSLSRDDLIEKNIKSSDEFEFMHYFRNKYMNCFESYGLEKSGVYIQDENFFVISLAHYSMDDTNADFFAKSSVPHMYLVAEFKKQSEQVIDNYRIFQIMVRRLSILRSILGCRYSLCQKIQEDIANNSLRESIQAREAELVMWQGKLTAHNGSEDIGTIIGSVSDMMKEWDLEQNIKKKDKIYGRICYSISQLTSLCIGLATNEYLLDNYFHSQDRRKSYIQNSAVTLFNPEEALAGVIDPSTCKTFVDIQQKFFTCFLRSLVSYGKYGNDNASNYLSYILRDDKVGTIRIYYDNKTDEDDIDYIWNSISSINSFPNWVTINNTSFTTVGCAFLIGIIDLFIRNVAKHAKGNDVDIFFEYNGDKNYYSFCVENDITNEKVDGSTGVTNWFFDVLNEKKDERDFLNFSITQRRNDERNRFESSITVYGQNKIDKERYI